MPITLHAAFVPTCRQLLGALAALVDRAEAFCAERGIAPAEIIGARLAPDMLPFAYQVKSTVVHSVGAIEGVRRGTFSPDMRPLCDDFAGLRALLADGIAALDAIDPQELEQHIGRDVAFVMGDFRMDFAAEDFLLSFSQINFQFHATTAYDLLRWKGMAIGKQDYAGRPRIKPRA